MGYATESSAALLATAQAGTREEVLAIIDPDNAPSKNVCRKLGFTFSEKLILDGGLRDLYTHVLGSGKAIRRVP